MLWPFEKSVIYGFHSMGSGQSRAQTGDIVSTQNIIRRRLYLRPVGGQTLICNTYKMLVSIVKIKFCHFNQLLCIFILLFIENVLYFSYSINVTYV